jgi:hypothetical protein
MGTNYYRIPTEEEMKRKKGVLEERVKDIPMSALVIESNFQYLETDSEWEKMSPWDEFVNKTNIHVGKRSSGWVFCWNFNKNTFYSDKEELLAFIRSGRIVNEYGEEIEVEEFIKMALDWGQPDGWFVGEKYYKEQYDVNGKNRPMFSDPLQYDTLVDGLRVSSSTEFC